MMTLRPGPTRSSAPLKQALRMKRRRPQRMLPLATKRQLEVESFWLAWQHVHLPRSQPCSWQVGGHLQRGRPRLLHDVASAVVSLASACVAGSRPTAKQPRRGRRPRHLTCHSRGRHMEHGPSRVLPRGSGLSKVATAIKANTCRSRYDVGENLIKACGLRTPTWKAVATPSSEGQAC